jgi:hypothetical protein
LLWVDVVVREEEPELNLVTRHTGPEILIHWTRLSDPQISSQPSIDAAET